MEVDGSATEFLATIRLAIFFAILCWGLGMFDFVPHSDWLGALIHLAISSVALLRSARLISDFRV